MKFRVRRLKSGAPDSELTTPNFSWWEDAYF